MNNAMTAGAPPPPMPGQDPTDDGQPDLSQGFTICLNVDAQGAITLEVEPLDTGDSDDSGAGQPDTSMGMGDASDAAPAPAGGDSDAQPVPSIQAALKLVQDIYNNKGQITAAAAPGAEQDAAANAFTMARGK